MRSQIASDDEELITRHRLVVEYSGCKYLNIPDGAADIFGIDSSESVTVDVYRNCLVIRPPADLFAASKQDILEFRDKLLDEHNHLFSKQREILKRDCSLYSNMPAASDEIIGLEPGDTAEIDVYRHFLIARPKPKPKPESR